MRVYAFSSSLESRESSKSIQPKTRVALFGKPIPDDRAVFLFVFIYVRRLDRQYPIPSAHKSIIAQNSVKSKYIGFQKCLILRLKHGGINVFIEPNFDFLLHAVFLRDGELDS